MDRLIVSIRSEKSIKNCSRSCALHHIGCSSTSSLVGLSSASFESMAETRFSAHGVRAMGERSFASFMMAPSRSKLLPYGCFPPVRQ